MRRGNDIEEALRKVATPERAAGSKRYPRSGLTFLGATVPQMRTEARAAAKEVGSRKELRDLADDLWGEPVLERRACAAFLPGYRVELLGPADLPRIKKYVSGSGTWALVDPLSADLLGDLLLAHPGAAEQLDPWALDGDFWVRRAALLSQIAPLKAGGDFGRFAGWADGMLGERECFIRKAIGWVLREAGKTRGAEVHG